MHCFHVALFSQPDREGSFVLSLLQPYPPAATVPAPPPLFEDPASAHRRSSSLPDFPPGVQAVGNSLYSLAGLHAGSEIVSVAQAQSPWNPPEYKADMLRDAPTFGGSSCFSSLTLGKPSCGLLGPLASLQLGPELQRPTAAKPPVFDPRLGPLQSGRQGLEGGPTQDPRATASLAQFQGPGASHVLSIMGLQQNPTQEFWGPLQRGSDMAHLQPLPEVTRSAGHKQRALVPFSSLSFFLCSSDHFGCGGCLKSHVMFFLNVPVNSLPSFLGGLQVPGQFLQGHEYGTLMGEPHAAHGSAAMLSHDPDGMCALCSERRALWTSLPCQHRALCTVCKERLQVCFAFPLFPSTACSFALLSSVIHLTYCTSSFPVASTIHIGNDSLIAGYHLLPAGYQYL